MKSSERSKRVKKYIQLHGAYKKRNTVEGKKRTAQVRREMYAILYEAGYSYEDISFLQGISRQKVEWLVKKGNETRKGYPQDTKMSVDNYVPVSKI